MSRTRSKAPRRPLTERREPYLGVFLLGFAMLLLVIAPVMVVTKGYFIYYGDFKDDAPTGTYPSTTSYSSYKFECVEYSDGDVSIGETKDGKRHGYGVYIWSDGGAWYGPWEDGERMGKGIYMSYDNKHTLGRWDKNTRYDN